MIIWQGFGIVVLAIPLASFFIALAIDIAIFGEGHLAVNHDLALITCGLLSTVATWKIGRRLNRQRIRVTDAAGNVSERYERETIHSLYMIPFEYWAIVYFILSALIGCVGTHGPSEH
jgi:hypothetical protein